VWRALRTIDPAKEEDGGGNPWVDEIHRFPVEVPKVQSVAAS
jgi:3-ketoacyl-CoA synthase